MKKALVWHLQTTQKHHGDSANEVHMVNCHWASPPPCQGAGSQSLSRWVCWPSHHKPWLNTREFTGAHKAGDEKRLELGDGKRKRDLYLLFSPHGTAHCPCHSSSMATHAPGWKVAAQTQVPHPDPQFVGCHTPSTWAQQEAGQCSTTQTQLHVPDVRKHWSFRQLDNNTWHWQNTCDYQSTLWVWMQPLSLGDKLIFVLIIREGTETQKGYTICSTQQKWTAEQGRWWLTDSHQISSTLLVFLYSWLWQTAIQLYWQLWGESTKHRAGTGHSYW